VLKVSHFDQKLGNSWVLRIRVVIQKSVDCVGVENACCYSEIG
jgi:hypothetical protein